MRVLQNRITIYGIQASRMALFIVQSHEKTGVLLISNMEIAQEVEVINQLKSYGVVIGVMLFLGAVSASMILFGGYLLIYVAAWGVILIHKRLRKENLAYEQNQKNHPIACFDVAMYSLPTVMYSRQTPMMKKVVCSSSWMVSRPERSSAMT